MSHSPPPLNPLVPNDPRIQSANFYGSSSGSSYDAYRYHQEQQPPHQQQHHHHSYYSHQQQTPFNTSPSSAESGSLPSALSLFGSGESGVIPAGTGPSPGRSPFVSQTAFAQPATPRRPKSHVASACVNCKKAHLACDTRRPCPRCVGLGKQETCVDVQHKKRGRPRLRDERSHSFEISHMQRPGIASSPSSPSGLSSSYRSGTHRVLKSQSSDTTRYSRRPSLTPREEILGHATGYFDPALQRPDRINLPPISSATAYLTTDLIVVKSTDGIRELLGYKTVDLDRRMSLFDLVLKEDHEKVYQLSSRILDEIREREPKMMLTESQLHSNIQAVDDTQASTATLASKTHSDVLHLRRPDGQYLKIRIRANLASTSVYFVVMVFSLVTEMPPPLQLNPNTTMNRSPVSVSTPPIPSPSFLTSANRPGSQAPFSHPGAAVDSRPRTLQPESSYPALAHYSNPATSPGSSTYYRHPISPAPMVPPAPGFGGQGMHAPLHIQNGLQLPPLQLKSPERFDNKPDRVRNPDAREEASSQTPRRERIDVKEMLE